MKTVLGFFNKRIEEKKNICDIRKIYSEKKAIKVTFYKDINLIVRLNMRQSYAENYAMMSIERN